MKILVQKKCDIKTEQMFPRPLSVGSGKFGCRNLSLNFSPNHISNISV